MADVSRRGVVHDVLPDVVHEDEGEELDEEPGVHPLRRMDAQPVRVETVLEVVEAVLDHVAPPVALDCLLRVGESSCMVEMRVARTMC